MKRFHGTVMIAVCLTAGLLLSGTAAAIDYRLAVKDDPCYPTAYYDHSGRDWNCGTFTYSGHRGNDFGIGGFTEMDKGRNVVAAAGGVVLEAHDGEYDRCTSGACSPPNGNYVKIQHDDGRITYYLHLRRFSVSVAVGQRVNCGIRIGQVGSSGYSTGPHLHFQVWDPQYGTDDPFAGSCGGPLSYWANQGAYMGLPGRACDPAGCGTLVSGGTGTAEHGGAALVLLLAPALFAVGIGRRLRNRL